MINAKQEEENQVAQQTIKHKQECESLQKKVIAKEIPILYKSLIEKTIESEINLVTNCTSMLIGKEIPSLVEIDSIWKKYESIEFEMSNFKADIIPLKMAVTIQDNINRVIPGFDIMKNPKLGSKYTNHYYIARWTLSACEYSICINKAKELFNQRKEVCI